MADFYFNVPMIGKIIFEIFKWDAVVLRRYGMPAARNDMVE